MKDTILSIIRHVLTFGGGFLVANGISQESATEIAAAIPAAIGLIWGAVDEYRASKATKTNG